MTHNVGTLDRALRILLGVALLTFALTGEHTAWWLLVGAIPLGTGLTGTCPVYRALGLSTLRRRRP